MAAVVIMTMNRRWLGGRVRTDPPKDPWDWEVLVSVVFLLGLMIAAAWGLFSWVR